MAWSTQKERAWDGQFLFFGVPLISATSSANALRAWNNQECSNYAVSEWGPDGHCAWCTTTERVSFYSWTQKPPFTQSGKGDRGLFPSGSPWHPLVPCPLPRGAHRDACTSFLRTIQRMHLRGESVRGRPGREGNVSRDTSSSFCRHCTSSRPCTCRRSLRPPSALPAWPVISRHVFFLFLFRPLSRSLFSIVCRALLSILLLCFSSRLSYLSFHSLLFLFVSHV